MSVLTQVIASGNLSVRGKDYSQLKLPNKNFNT